MTWRIRLVMIGVTIFIIVLAMSPLKIERATAAPLLQFTATFTNTPPVGPTDTPSPTDTPFPTDTPQPQPTDTPGGPTLTPQLDTPTPRPTNEPGTGGGGGAPPGPSGTPAVNGCVRSIGKNGINLSTEPGFYQSHIQIIPRERLAQVLAGPERVDTIWWWRLRTDAGVEGWGNQDEMTPDPGPCAFGASASPGGQTPPYPVTVVPSFSFEQPSALEQPSGQAVPPGQATPASQETLPQTGGNLEWWFLAGMLAITVLVVGFVRRRLQTQPATSGSSLREDETDIRK
jgi:LPXTG-motif cell wall-anchored protein